VTATARIVLASASPRRLAILRRIGLDPEVRPAHIDESHDPRESATECVRRLARAKAQRVADDMAAELREQPSSHVPVMVVGGDTIVATNREILGKPSSKEKAVEMLTKLSGQWHTVFTGIATILVDGGACGRMVSTVVATKVQFHVLSRDMIHAYVATGEPLDKAGAYGVQRFGSVLIEKIEGDFFAVMGLSVASLVHMWDWMGWSYRFGELTRDEP